MLANVKMHSSFNLKTRNSEGPAWKDIHKTPARAGRAVTDHQSAQSGTVNFGGGTGTASPVMGEKGLVRGATATLLAGLCSPGVFTLDLRYPIPDASRQPRHARARERERKRERERERYDQNEVSAKPPNRAPVLVCTTGT